MNIQDKIKEQNDASVLTQYTHKYAGAHCTKLETTHTQQHAPEEPYVPAGHAAQTVAEVPPAARGQWPQVKIPWATRRADGLTGVMRSGRAVHKS